MEEKMREYLESIKQLVRECGHFILNAERNSIEVESKEGSANFVTKYDREVQRRLKEGLMKIVPDSVFVGEEDEDEVFDMDKNCFIVDPIDGTTNFIKDYHMSCISVAFFCKGVSKIAVVYNPYLDEMFWAERGCGAYCNGRRLSVSEKNLENGIVLFGTSPYYEELNRKSFDMAYDYFKKALDIRRSGSAALDLCSIAAGRAELYFELKLSPWDYAAGILLVEEAGGIVTTIENGPVSYEKPCSILARNKD